IRDGKITMLLHQRPDGVITQAFPAFLFRFSIQNKSRNTFPPQLLIGRTVFVEYAIADLQVGDLINRAEDLLKFLQFLFPRSFPLKQGGFKIRDSLINSNVGKSNYSKSYDNPALSREYLFPQ